MSINKAVLVIPAVFMVLLPSRLFGSDGSDLTLETKTAMIIVKHHAMGIEKEAGNTGMTGVHHFAGTHLAYTFETRRLWVRYFDSRRERPGGEEDYASVGEDDELILMDYETTVAYIHQSGLHENEFYHVRIIAENLEEKADEGGDQVYFVEFLKAKVPEVGSVYPDKWDEDEELIVRESFGKKIRAFCAEFNTELTAGLKD